MRVTFFNYIHGSVGPKVQMDEFVSAFRHLGHEVFVESLAAVPEPALESSTVKYDKTGWKKNLSRMGHELNTLLKNFKYYARECEILEKQKPDVVLSRYKLYHISSGFSTRRHHFPLVLLVDAPASFEQKTYLKQFFRIPGIAEFMERTAIRMAQRCITVSEETKQYLPLTREMTEHIQEIPNGVDIEKFKPCEEGQKIREQLFPAGKVVLGFVGSFSPWHGIENLKTILDFCLKKYDNTAFLLIGDGPRQKEMQDFAAQKAYGQGRVIFAGQVEHSKVPAYLAALDIGLLPYDKASDGFYFSPLKLFEYMACEKPVLAANLGQIERIVQDGENGCIYPVENTEVMLRQLKELIENPELRQRIGRTARQTVTAKYTWHHTAAGYEKVLEDAIRLKKRDLK